ncbi:MAG TPA: DUF4126 domain-containing protein [Vicinamibacteria bacterium]|nr:DUF4126 domain-containing protein [Vicinamibacteria bacterium]
MEHFLSVSLGLGLAAACGFRVFVPLLIMSAASYTGHLGLSEGFEWVGSFPALVAFGTATVVEVLAYYVPWVDNLLDTLAGPAAVVAGAVVTASAMTDVDPLVKWTLAVIGGGGLAGLVKGATTVARGASTAATGGLANPILATMELGTSFVLALVAVALPLLALVLVGVTVLFLVRKLAAHRARRQTA